MTLRAARILDRFEIPYELAIVSARHMPDRLVEYARSSVARGLRVIVAGAARRLSLLHYVRL